MNDDDFAKALLADCEAFEASITVSHDALTKLANDTFAKFLATNEELRKALAQPAQRF